MHILSTLQELMLVGLCSLPYFTKELSVFFFFLFSEVVVNKLFS